MSNVDRMINRCIILLFVCMLILITISVIVNLVAEKAYYVNTAQAVKDGAFADDTFPISTGVYGGHWYMDFVYAGGEGKVSTPMAVADPGPRHARRALGWLRAANRLSLEYGVYPFALLSSLETR